MSHTPFTVDLAGKTAVVTGGTGVLGSVLAAGLAHSGAKVAILGRREEQAQQVADEITAAGGTALAVAADVLDRDSLHQARQRITEHLGACDILVNGAGGNDPQGTTTHEYLTATDTENTDPNLRTFFDITDEGIRKVMDLNYLGTVTASQEFARDMIGRPGATIINISSMNAYTPLTKIPVYSAAKAAVTNLTQWMAVHFAREGIRVNAIAPGFFATQQNHTLLFDEHGEPTARAAKILAGTPMDRFGQPDELVGALLFLASSDASGFVNGAILPVDGAFSAYSGV